MSFDYDASIKIIDDEAAYLCDLSDRIWDTPETAFGEDKTAAALIEALKHYGFEVSENLAGIETAFSGRFGSGKPVIGILGEFDALSGLSQQAGLAEKKPLVENGAGHGCGHNLLGVGSLAAALSVMQYIKDTGASGTVIYYGCPGEEGGSGKAFMARDGVFDELDCAITWHPWDINAASFETSLANYQVAYRFKGVSAHAAATPHLGRSALDAVELMNTGVQYLREHVIDKARIHYAITDTGGFSPNVVQARAQVLYLIRAPKNPQVKEIFERINKIAEGAALMTETEMQYDFIKACSNMVTNETLIDLLQEQLLHYAPPVFTEQEQKFAEDIIASFENPGSRYENELSRYDKDDAQKLKPLLDKPLYDFVAPRAKTEGDMGGSTDVGDVSWICPTAQIFTTAKAANTPAHSWQQTAQGKSGIAHKGMLYAAKVMGSAACRLLQSPDIVEKAKQEHKERLDGHKYECAIPKDVRPRKIAPKG